MNELPLKEMDSYLLGRALILEAVRCGIDQRELEAAMDLAAFLHRKQTRANRGDMPRTHYIEHPLRNALRLLRYGCLDQGIIVAAVLHDVVEDCLLEIFSLDDAPTPTAWSGIQAGLDFVRRSFGNDVECLVGAVTNPVPPGMDFRTRAQKRADYVSHVTRSIEDPRAALLKLTDFVDNAAGLHHNDVLTNSGMISHLSQKYLPLVPVFRARIRKQDVQDLVSDEGYNKILLQLDKAGKTLQSLSVLR
jgi:(p)ppGpp synthase/HD superfamily hydrolase